ncbi:hypothetical protein [Anaeromassilibacillus sp. An250]|uniref:hypothetical protein n=1 Tax=Anaeromassilibacillus sp. An250 TaxID=1965604 RepID=UPI000B39064C|nr:hypothetical protein [Anaeromassilibacillus sp. An250]OUO73804.1 hypothetical protein B5F54_09160 [Anaeromassilibacillus sp. An250]
MKEYIERAAVEKIIEDGLNNPDKNKAFGHDAIEIMAEIHYMPAADVAEVKHGRWEPGNPICPVCGENKFKDLDADVWADWQPKFCPNCGARMDKEDEHEAG